jgi:hypothetical protein
MALVDSGATLSLVSRTFYDRLRKHQKSNSLKIVPHSRRLNTADCKPMQVSTALETDICISGLKIPISLIVIDNLCHPIILGMNFLKDTKADIQLTKNTLSLYNGLLSVPLIRSGQSPSVYPIANVTVPPQSQSIFEVEIIASFPLGTYEMEQHTRMHKPSVLIARSVVQPKDRKWFAVCLIQPTKR